MYASRFVGSIPGRRKVMPVRARTTPAKWSPTFGCVAGMFAGRCHDACYAVVDAIFEQMGCGGGHHFATTESHAS